MIGNECDLYAIRYWFSISPQSVSYFLTIKITRIDVRIKQLNREAFKTCRQQAKSAQKSESLSPDVRPSRF